MDKSYKLLLQIWLTISLTLNGCLIVYGNFLLLIPFVLDSFSFFALHSKSLKLKEVVFIMQILVTIGFIVLECISIHIKEPRNDDDANSKMGFIVEVIMGAYLFAGYIIGNIMSLFLFYKHIQYTKLNKKSFDIEKCLSANNSGK